MAKLTVGAKMPDFIFDTPFTKGRSMAETAGGRQGKTAVVFLRYYGCTTCQYEMHLYAQAHDKITAHGGQLLVVLQSDPAKLAAQLKEAPLPFEIISDPEGKLYRLLDIAPAECKEKMGNAATRAKKEKAIAAGFQHGEFEGDELQLPAAFVLEPDGTVTYAHYGVAVGDQPSAEELEELLK